MDGSPPGTTAGPPSVPDLGGTAEIRRGQSLPTPLAHTVGPLAAAAVVAILTRGSADVFEGSALTFLAFLLGGLVLRREGQHTALLPLTGSLLALAPAVLGLAGLTTIHLLFDLPALPVWELALVALLGGTVTLGARRLLGPHRTLRTAIIGARPGSVLASELELAGVARYELVGVIAPDGQTARDLGREVDGLPVLGSLNELGGVVERQGIELLLMTSGVSRLAVFEEMARSCLHLSVRLWELTGFYEEVFGHVPVGEINASWFQYIMHPRFNASAGASKRVVDLVIAGAISVFCLPLIGLLGLLVKSDGGSAFFKQVRIGESGRPFTVYKLRTMREGTAPAAQWASASDPRITGLGRVLRKSHLDELPQLLNVLRGDMSLVGPRPEQPEFVERLESTVPFYSRRHLIRPGVTGWAQVRCGYAGSDLGSAWKLCHDLYYLKHRTLGLDFAIIAETVRTLVADRQYGIEPAGVSFIMRKESPEALKPAQSAAA